MVTMNDAESLTLAEHKEWVARLSDEEFEKWEIAQTKFAIVHFGHVEASIAEAIDKMQQDPHELYNISIIGSYLKSLGEMMQDYDYLGSIKIGLGHDKELDIMNKIESIAAEIKDGLEGYLEYKLSKESGKEERS
jgi:hypothetical protein